MSKYKIPLEVHLILIQNDKILMLRRYNTGYEDGNYSLVAGHVEENENATDAIIREAKEESGILITRENIVLSHVMHRYAHGARMSLFYVANIYDGKITNEEPHKCDDLSWKDIENIPDNTIPYIKTAILNSFNGINYSEFGW